MNSIKFQFALSYDHSLNREINQSGIYQLPNKTETTFSIPTRMMSLHRFGGLLNFYHCFIPQYAETVRLVINLLTEKKNVSDTVQLAEG